MRVLICCGCVLYGYVVYVCCVGFAPLDVGCDELHDYTWNVGISD